MDCIQILSIPADCAMDKMLQEFLETRISFPEG